MGALHRELDFLDHLEALRRNFLLAAAFFVAAAAAAFLFADSIVLLLRRPADLLALPLYTLRPQEKFLTYLRVALQTSVVATIPLVLLLAVHFLIPALTRRERRLVLPVAAGILLLYLSGLAFAFSVVSPIAITFFADFRAGDGIRPLWSLQEYVRLLFSLVFAFSLVFQSPVILLLLVRLGVLHVETLRRFRRHALLLILVLSAVVTPPDVLTQLLVALPLYLLYEGTIVVARLWLRRKRRKEVLAWTEENS